RCWRAVHPSSSSSLLEKQGIRPEFNRIPFVGPGERASLIDAPGAGPAALERRDAVQRRFATQLEAIHHRARADIPAIPEVPPHTFRAAVGAVNELVIAHVLEHGAPCLPDLTDAILDVHLALLIGRELAQRIASSYAPNPGGQVARRSSAAA